MDGGFHLRCKDAVDVTLSDEPQLLAINFIDSNGSPTLAGNHLVDMLPQSGLPSVEEHFVPFGRQVLPLVGVADLEPDDIPGVAHASLMSVPLDAL